MSDDPLVPLKFQINELREAAAWKEQFCQQQQDKSRFFITLLSTLMFVVGLSLNNVPPQKYLLAPCAVSFLICFGFAFWSMYYFAKVIEPRHFHGRNETDKLRGNEGEEVLLKRAQSEASRQNEHIAGIVAIQSRYLNQGIYTFVVFNIVFGVALIVSRLSWFLPGM